MGYGSTHGKGITVTLVYREESNVGYDVAIIKTNPAERSRFRAARSRTVHTGRGACGEASPRRNGTGRIGRPASRRVFQKPGSDFIHGPCFEVLGGGGPIVPAPPGRIHALPAVAPASRACTVYASLTRHTAHTVSGGLLKHAIRFHAFGVTSSFVLAAHWAYASFLRIQPRERRALHRIVFEQPA